MARGGAGGGGATTIIQTPPPLCRRGVRRGVSRTVPAGRGWGAPPFGPTSSMCLHRPVEAGGGGGVVSPVGAAGCGGARPTGQSVAGGAPRAGMQPTSLPDTRIRRGAALIGRRPCTCEAGPVAPPGATQHQTWSPVRKKKASTQEVNKHVFRPTNTSKQGQARIVTGPLEGHLRRPLFIVDPPTAPHRTLPAHRREKNWRRVVHTLRPLPCCRLSHSAGTPLPAPPPPHPAATARTRWPGAYPGR